MTQPRNETLAIMLTIGTLFLSLSTASAEQCKNPDALRFSLVPAEEISQAVDQYKPFVHYLSKETGKKIEFFLPTSYASVLEGFLGGWVDLGMLGPDTYVIGKGKDPSIEVFATRTNKNGPFEKEEWAGYKAILVVSDNSKYQNIEDLKGAVLGLVDPASTSGNLIPRISFGKVIHTGLENYFSKIVYTGAHDQSAVAVRDGRIDAAFVATLALDYAIRKGVVKKDDFRVIWASETIPNVPYVMSSKLCPELVEKVKHAFFTLQSDEGGRKFLASMNSTKFVPIKDKDYDLIRELRKVEKGK